MIVLYQFPTIYQTKGNDWTAFTHGVSLEPKIPINMDLLPVTSCFFFFPAVRNCQNWDLIFKAAIVVVCDS